MIFFAHIIASITILVILYFAIYKVFQNWYAKRQSFFEQEKQKSANNLASSEVLKKKAQLQITSTEKMMSELMLFNKKEIQHIRKNVLLQAEKEKNDLINHGQLKARQIQLGAQAEIKKTIVENSLLLTEKILKQKITVQNQQKLINDFMENLNEK
ncbi:MAG: hypothetical protein QJQ54_02700 [Mollicutes bacterium]|nr:MAG: hypothetical protein QJQ54_02700 [Mollicutes bacterium]